MAIGEFHLSSHFASMQVVGSTPATPSLCPVNLNQKKTISMQEESWKMNLTRVDWGNHRLKWASRL